MKNLEEQLVEKSIEAFIMGLEIYNKPTIKYRIEGFSFFICNAWELMLKAHLCKKKGRESIYFKDSFDRTISLEKCIELIFTNNKDPLRINLEKIVALRNTSTHFITEDYERVYAPLFQACVINYSNKLQDFHRVDITEKIPLNFLTLSISLDELSDEQIRAKYTPQLAEKLIIDRNDIKVTTDKTNHKYAITIQQNLYITKKIKDADINISVSRDAEAKGIIIKELRDPSNTHKFSFKHLIDEVNKQIADANIPFSHSNSNGKSRNKFNTRDLTEFIKFYDMKSNQKYSYEHVIGNNNHFSYSLEAANFIVGEIKKNPGSIIADIKKANKKR